MAYTPTYTTGADGNPMAQVVKTDAVGLTIGGKIIPGYQTTFSDGTSKWITTSDTNLNSGYDYSTFTSKKDANGNWVWTPSGMNSIQNLSNGTGIPTTQINKSLYQNPALQTTLNGNRVNQLGGISNTQKIDPSIPGTAGTTSNPNQPIQQTGSSPTYSQAGVGQLASANVIKTQIGTDRIRQALGGKDIVYPTKLRTNKQDFIKFTMVDYGQKEFQLAKAGKNLGLGKRTLLNDSIISVYLPIQPSINDQNDIGWGEDNMNVFKAVLANIATQGSATTLASELDKVGEIFGSGEYETVIRRSLGGAAVGINPIARTDGLVLNPNLELLFSGPSLRPFNFTFKLSPRDKDEAKEVKNVIKFFKLGSTVRTTADSIFLRAPYVFNIAYKYNGPDDKNDGHPGLNKIKTCALRTVTVNYTPDGSYMTFEDGTMTSYEISLQFCELEPVYDTDYLENNNLIHPIGF